MTAELKLSIDNDTGKPLAEAVKSFEQLGKAADAAEKELNDTGSAARKAADAADGLSVESVSSGLTELRNQVADLRTAISSLDAARLDKLQDEVDDVGDEADETARKLKGVGDAASKADKPGLFGGTLAKIRDLTVAALGMKETIAKVGQAVNFLADTGSPAFGKLRDSFTEAQTALVSIANDPAVQEWVTSLASAITTTLVPAMKSIPGLARSMVDSIADGIASAGESVGLFAEGTSSSLQEMQKQQAKSLEQQREALALQRHTVDVDKQLADLRAKLMSDEETANALRSDSLVGIRAAIEDEIDALRALKKESVPNKEKEAESLRKITALQSRLLQVERERAAAEVKMSEEAANARIDKEREYVKAVAEAQKAVDARRSARLDEARKAADAARDELMKVIAEAKGLQGGNLVDEARGKLSGKDVRNELIQQRQREALGKFNREAIDRGDVNQFGIATARDGESQRDAERRVGAQRQRAMREAEGSVTRDINRGKLGSDEVRSAQDSLLKQSIEAAQSQGKLGDETAAAMRALLDQQAEAAAKASEQEQAVKEVREAIGGKVRGGKQSREQKTAKPAEQDQAAMTPVAAATEQAATATQQAGSATLEALASVVTTQEQVANFQAQLAQSVAGLQSRLDSVMGVQSGNAQRFRASRGGVRG